MPVTVATLRSRGRCTGVSAHLRLLLAVPRDAALKLFLIAYVAGITAVIAGLMLAVVRVVEASCCACACDLRMRLRVSRLSLIHISEPTRPY